MTDTAPLPLSARAAARPPEPVWLADLNPAQRQAVEALDGPVLMLAGAGTGKTRALTARIAHLVALGRARPHEILAVTFTNKAAREMKDRVARLLGEAGEGMPWLGTFHAIGVKILRRHAELVGLKGSFTILDTDDQIRLMKQVITAAGLDEKRLPARLLAQIIDGWKNRALAPDRVPGAEGAEFEGHAAALYAAYQRRLAELNACDFGDLLLHGLTIFRSHEDILAQWQRRFRYILVDEYQDTNVAQYLWLRLLAQAHHNICCVGDDDQSIYGWRGAEVGNILRFERDFPGAKVIRLEQNYRSTPHILAVASGVIAANRGRLGKTLWTEAQEGEKVRLIGHWDGEEEARWIGEEIESMQRGTRGMEPFGLDDIAILVRAGHQMRAFEDRFLAIGLPYRVIGGPRFYERQEIRDAMAYFRLAVSPGDDLAFERVVNLPRRGLGEKALQTIRTTARDRGMSLAGGAAAALAGRSIAGKGAAGLRTFLDGVARWHAAVLAGANHVELAQVILDESGYTAMWQADRAPEAEGRLENLKELVKALGEFDNLQGFLEHVALVMDNDSGDSGARVTLMTLHAAKGLEFPAVFLPGWEDGLFPSQRSMDEGGLEEERRLAYVGITRARRFCVISFAGNRRVWGQWQNALPSRFIDELPPDHVEVLTPPGLYGSGATARPAPADPPSPSASAVEARAVEADVYNSPGWRRLLARGVQPQAPVRPARPAEGPAFDAGARVFHQKFGYGTIRALEGDKCDVAFDHAGDKKVVARFLVAAAEAGEMPF